MEPELKAKYDAIAAEMGDDQFFTKKELNYLPEILDAGEDVIAFSSGMVDGNTWLIALTGSRVIFLDKGMIYGLKQISIDLERINSVEGSTGLLFGKIVITDGARSYEITNVWKKTVKPFTNKLRDAMTRRRTGAGTASAPAPANDRIAQLERLAALRDSGVLTGDEFTAEKARILAG